RVLARGCTVGRGRCSGSHHATRARGARPPGPAVAPSWPLRGGDQVRQPPAVPARAGLRPLSAHLRARLRNAGSGGGRTAFCTRRGRPVSGAPNLYGAATADRQRAGGPVSARLLSRGGNRGAEAVELRTAGR